MVAALVVFQKMQRRVMHFIIYHIIPLTAKAAKAAKLSNLADIPTTLTTTAQAESNICRHTAFNRLENKRE